LAIEQMPPPAPPALLLPAIPLEPPEGTPLPEVDPDIVPESEFPLESVPAVLPPQAFGNAAAVAVAIKVDKRRSRLRVPIRGLSINMHACDKGAVFSRSTGGTCASLRPSSGEVAPEGHRSSCQACCAAPRPGGERGGELVQHLVRESLHA
jgi:hypothetical protein